MSRPPSTYTVHLLPWICFTLLNVFFNEVHGQFPLVIVVPATSVFYQYLAASVAFDLDFRKHAEPDLIDRFGPPVVEVPDPLLSNLSFNLTVAPCDSDDAAAFDLMLDLIEGGSRGIVGLAQSTASSIAAHFASHYKVPQISYAASSVELSDKARYAYFLRTVASDSVQGRAMWRFLQQCSIRSVSFICSLESYGENLYQAVYAHVQAETITLTLTPFAMPYSPGSPTVNTTESLVRLTAAMDASTTKVIFLALTADQAVLLFPVAQEAGLFTSQYQVVGSDSLPFSAGPDFLPDGYIYFYPAYQGSRYQALQSMWQALTYDDLVGDIAMDRYSLRDYEVDLEALDDASLNLTGVDEPTVAFLFDAAYSFVFALNALLNEGAPLEAITGEALLSALKNISFEGVSGPVQFDSNGDRQISFYILNVQSSQALQVAIFSPADDVITLMNGTDLLWTEGSSGLKLPSAFIDCESGSFLDSSAACQPCPTGEVPTSDRRSCETCPGHTVPLNGTCGYNPLKVGVIGAITSISLEYIAAVVMFDLDFRKNFEPELVDQFGPPIIPMEDLSPGLRIELQLGNSDGEVEAGLAEALDLFQGQNGREAIAALVGGIYSSVTIPIAGLATQFEVPVISYGATSAKLSSKDEYPFFLRTIPPDSVQAAAMWCFIQVYEAGAVTYLYSEEIYGEGLFQVVSNLAAKDNEAYRIEAASLPYMIEFDNIVGLATIAHVKSLPSKVIFLAMTSDQGVPLFPLAEQEGLFEAPYQVLGAESVGLGFWGDVHPPLGYIWFAPVSEGELYAAFQTMWTKLSADNVTGNEARERYGIDLFKVPIEGSSVDPLTDATFASSHDIVGFVSMLFDALYALAFAADALLKNGSKIESITGSELLAALYDTDFVGTSGGVTFDENGDRLASFNIWNFKPTALLNSASATDTAESSSNSSSSNSSDSNSNSSNNSSTSGSTIVFAIYSSVENAIQHQEEVPYWMLGEVGEDLPSSLTACTSGHYKNENLICLSCSAGTYSSGGSVTECQRCPAGQRANSALAATGCLDCTAGSAGLEVASTNCTVCSAGSYSDSDASTSCEACEQGYYQSSSGQTSCTACGDNMLTLVKGSSSEAECLCAEGYYRDSQEDQHAPCLPCKEGMTCASGSDMKHFYAWLQGQELEDHETFPKLLPSYMSLLDDPLSVFHCTDSALCPGGSPGTCAVDIASGVSGCAYCRDDYYWNGEACEVCTWREQSPLLFPLLPLLLSPIFFALLYRFSSTNSADWGSWRQGMSAILFLLLNHFQTTTLLNNSNLAKSLGVMQVMRALEIADDPISIFNTDCAGYREKAGSMALKTMTPVALLVMLLLTFLTATLLEGVGILQKRWHADVVFNVYFSLLFTFFAGIVAMSLDTFKCSDNPNGQSTLSSDQSILCGSDDWWVLVGIATVAVCLYLLGIGGLFAWVVIVAPRRFEDEGFRKRWGFLFYRFRPDVWWWGLLHIGKGICTNMGYMFFRLGLCQIVWVMFTMAVYAASLTLFFPWRLRAVNGLDLYTCVAVQFVAALMATYAYAQSQASEPIRDGLSTATIIVNLSPLLVALGVASYILYVHTHPGVRRARARQVQLLSPALDNFGRTDLQQQQRFLESMDEWAQSYIIDALYIIRAEFHGDLLKARLTDKHLMTKSISSGVSRRASNSSSAASSDRGHSPIKDGSARAGTTRSLAEQTKSASNSCRAESHPIPTRTEQSSSQEPGPRTPTPTPGEGGVPGSQGPTAGQTATLARPTGPEDFTLSSASPSVSASESEDAEPIAKTYSV